MAEAAALSWRQDPRPFHQPGSDNTAANTFPCPTQPHSHRGEPEAHTPEAAYTKPFNYCQRSWLKSLETQVSTEWGLCRSQGHPYRKPGSVPISYSQDRLATQAVNFGSSWLCNCSGWDGCLSGSPSVNEDAGTAPIHSSYRKKGILIKAQAGAFHPTVKGLRSSPRAGQQN